MMKLEIIHNLSKKVTVLENLEDKNTSALFYCFDICLEGQYEDGEYTYRLLDGETVVASGLLQIGDFERDTNKYKEYNNEDKGYIVYGE